MIDNSVNSDNSVWSIVIDHVLVSSVQQSESVTHISRTSLGAQMVKNLSAMQETEVQSLGQEDTLQKGMATHSSILAWKIPWTEEPGWLQFMGSQRVRHN